VSELSEYEKIHVDGVVIENESSGVRGLAVNISVDTLGAVIIEFGESMTIRTDFAGAETLANLIRDATATLDEMEENAAAVEKSSGCNLLNDPITW
jgi:hypothetical protein